MAPAPPGEISFVVDGPIRRRDLAGLSARLCRLLARDDVELAVCELRGVEADAVAVDALARLHLAARRRGSRLSVRGASADLRELVSLLGLRDVLSP
jgi:ABC-type transporter Mla MlaB component